MELIDFSNCKTSLRVYGGSAGRKNGIIFNDKNFLLKFPGSTSGIQNVEISYTNSPLCEFIGSHIYDFFGIPCHKTMLGKKDGKLVVACEDFLADSDHLYEFAQLKVTFTPHFVDSNGEITNGTGTDLKEILLTIEQHDFLQNMRDVKERFWDMFVIDAFIGNPDRNNGNWGIILHSDKTFSLAPVYDNGNSFNNKWDDEKMKKVLSDSDLLKKECYEAKTCVFTLHGKRINPYHIIQNMEYTDCNAAMLRLVPKMKMKMQKIKSSITELPENFGDLQVISKMQKEFFLRVLDYRFNNFFIPIYNSLENTTTTGAN
ncbi:MAG: HipA domain-containing protein [Treponema sp.]|nr:HipA domain-containing protein [Treponema sp.]